MYQHTIIKSNDRNTLDKKQLLEKFSTELGGKFKYLANGLLNSTTDSIEAYLPFMIDKCSPYDLPDLIGFINNLNIDYSEQLSPIINKCNAYIIPKLIRALNNSKADYFKQLGDIVNKCAPNNMDLLITSLNDSNIDYSKYLASIINKCDLNIIDNLVISINKSNIDFKKQLTPNFFGNITNIKALQHVITNTLFGANTRNVISQVSFILENIKDPSLSDMDRKKIIYINKLIKKVYTTENKEELYNIFNLSSQSKTSYSNIINTVTHKMVDNFYDKNLGIDINKHRTCLNPKIDKDIKLGIEIETAGSGENEISNLKLNNFSYYLDRSVSNYNKRTNSLYGNGNGNNNITGELVSEIIDPYNENDISNIYDVCKTLKQNGTTTNFTCGLHVHVSGKDISKDNPKALDALLADMVLMQEIFINKLNIYSSRINEYTTLIPPDFSGKSLEFLQYCEEVTFSNKHYMLNLLSLKKHGTLEFRLFNLPDSIDENMILAYADMATSMVNSARKKGSFYDTIQNTYNLKNIDLNDKNVVDPIYDKFLDYIDVSKDTKKILTNMDKVFDFYKAKELQTIELGKQAVDFHTPKNKILPTPVSQININKNTDDVLYSVETRTISTTDNPKTAYFYPYKNDIDKNNNKQLVKPIEKRIFRPKSINKEPEPYCLVV